MATANIAYRTGKINRFSKNYSPRPSDVSFPAKGKCLPFLPCGNPLLPVSRKNFCPDCGRKHFLLPILLTNRTKPRIVNASIPYGNHRDDPNRWRKELWRSPFIGCRRCKAQAESLRQKDRARERNCFPDFFQSSVFTELCFFISGGYPCFTSYRPSTTI